MSDDSQSVVEMVAPAVPVDPISAIKTRYPNAPSQAVIDSWKQQVPGGKVRFFELPDGKRAFFLRAISPLELAKIQDTVARMDPSKQPLESQILIVTLCTLWSNFTQSGKLIDMELRQAGAGLPASMQAVIWDLSDYVDPAAMDSLILDL